ncbi:MAG: sulfatase [Myxococcales bacterium]|jgi:arylsulfatase
MSGGRTLATGAALGAIAGVACGFGLFVVQLAMLPAPSPDELRPLQARLGEQCLLTAALAAVAVVAAVSMRSRRGGGGPADARRQHGPGGSGWLAAAVLVVGAQYGLATSGLQPDAIAARALWAAWAAGSSAALVLGLRFLWRWTGSPRPVPGSRPAAVMCIAAAALVRLTAAPALVAAGSGGRGDAPRLNVLLVVVDCLRPDRLAAHGGPDALTLPALDRLAQLGRVHLRAYSTASWTKPAVASVVTGVYAHEHATVRLGDGLPRDLPTVATRLQAAGYLTSFYGGGNTWIGRAFGFERGYEQFDEVAGRGDRLADRFIAQLSEPDPRPFFTYLHFMDVHEPYGWNGFTRQVASTPFDSPYTDPGRVDTPWLRRRQAAGLLTGHDRARVRALYDAQVRFFDSQLARILVALEQRGELQHTLVVVTADHGEELWDHDTFGHGHSVRETPIRVPLLVMGPGLEAGRVHTPVSLVDVAPTILELAAGLDTSGMSGKSLVGPRDHRMLHLTSSLNGHDKVGVVWDRRKLVRVGPRHSTHGRMIGRDAPRGLWGYDLGSDPAEDVAQDATGSRAFRELAEALQPVEAELLETSAEDEPLGLDDETVERLRALGYAE